TPVVLEDDALASPRQEDLRLGDVLGERDPHGFVDVVAFATTERAGLPAVEDDFDGLAGQALAGPDIAHRRATDVAAGIEGGGAAEGAVNVRIAAVDVDFPVDTGEAHRAFGASGAVGVAAAEDVADVDIAIRRGELVHARRRVQDHAV